jgi:hypothetical protein
MEPAVTRIVQRVEAHQPLRVDAGAKPALLERIDGFFSDQRQPRGALPGRSYGTAAVESAHAVRHVSRHVQ